MRPLDPPTASLGFNLKTGGGLRLLLAWRQTWAEPSKRSANTR
jgi:hypothetical protein